MALVKFVKDQRADAAQIRIDQHLPQEHAFGDVTDPCRGRDNIIQPHPVPDVAAKFHAARLRDPGRQHPGRQPARLQNDDLAIAQKSTVEQHLRHLGRFSRAGWRSENQASLRLRRFQ